MASEDNPLQPLINPSTSLGSSHVKYTDSLPLTTINMTPISLSSDKMKLLDNKQGLTQRRKKKPSPTEDIFMTNISGRLHSRKELLNYLSLVTDVMCFLGIMGIILMIVENEISFAQIDNRETITTWIFKLIMTITTICLVILVFIYHRLDLAFYAVRHHSNAWHIGLTYKRVFLIIIEVVVCAIHPVVPAFPKESGIPIDQSNSMVFVEHSVTYTPAEVSLSLLMFLRLYLLFRFGLYHSRLVRDIGSRSVGYLNQVSITYSFLIKTYVAQWPVRCLVVFCVTILLVGSWSLRVCDYDSNERRLRIFAAAWFFIQIFTTLGSGDRTPSTYCGRTISALIAFLGVIASALLINVVAQKIILTRWENYVHNYVINTELAQQHKAESANVVKYSFKLWMLKRSRKPMSTFHYFCIKRKLFQSINAIHKIRKQQRDLVDNCIGLPEVQTLERRTNTITGETMKRIGTLQSKIDNVEQQLNDVKQSVDNIENALNRLADRISQ